MALYRFGVFEFDSEAGELQKTGRRVRLRPQPAKVLEHLLKRHGELVTRAELQRAIWPDGTFVHFDAGLNSCIKQIRAALGDRQSAALYIETLVRRGFRFIAPTTIAPTQKQPGLRGKHFRVLPVPLLGPGALPAEVAVADSELAGVIAGSDLDTPIRFVLAVTVRLAGNELQVTSTLIDARSQVPGTQVSDAGGVL
jgi:DNA-binding winged helix-turn-helix (wHTH) protein